MATVIRPLPQGVPDDLGAPDPPASKSHAQRALLLAAFLDGERTVAGASGAEDVHTLARALAALGAGVTWRGEDVVVRGTPRPTASAAVDVGENGTALRTLLVAVPMLGGKVALDAAPGLRRRPHEAAFEVLRQAGCAPQPSWPLLVDGGGAEWPACLEVDATVTTQVATGALLGLACRAARGDATPRTVRVCRAAAGAYIDVTAEVLGEAGFAVHRRASAGAEEFEVEARASAPQRLCPPVDASGLLFPEALATLARRGWTMVALRRARDAHPDWAAAADFAALRGAAPGAPVTLAGLGARPDSFPALAVAAAGRPGRTTLRGAPSLRRKESDRVAAMAQGLLAAGIRCRELADGLVVEGLDLHREDALEPRRLPCARDHRVVMALALLGAVRPGGVQVEHEAAVAKSWPRFFSWLSRVARVERDRPLA
jgi:3-phosphoshikimate 1-carboxyvinyltransferase